MIELLRPQIDTQVLREKITKVIILTGRVIDLPDIMDASRVIYLPDMDAIESKDPAKRGSY